MSAHRHPLVGVSGKKRHGKDTLAERLIAEHGYTRVAFADPMREAALALDPLIPVGPQHPLDVPDRPPHIRLSRLVEEKGYEDAKANGEVRRTLQRLGTEMGRNVFGDSFWVDQLKRRIDEIDGPVVITDVRFTNEADAVKAWGGTLVRVVRPDVESTDTHASETQLDGYSFPLVVLNDGTVDDLWVKAEIVAGFAQAQYAAVRKEQRIAA